ncbi:N-acetylmuramoyl-L-alanine amidase family protein, partial [Clostridium botulinum]|nr:N-acetylmuramoyl-L-alanine amidase family protein [Clostridium botulinum]
NYLDKINATNETTKEDILKGVLITNENIKAQIVDYNKVDSTDLKEGSIKGKLIINSRSATKEIPIDLIISKLAQSSINAKDNIDNTLKNIKVTNETIKEDILNAIKVGVDTETVKITIENFNKIDSTEINKGKITGIIKINDGKTEETINLNQEVEQLDQSIETVEKLFKNYLDKINATNETTKEDILKGVLITNENIKAQIVDYNKVDSTDLKEGSIKGKLIINSGSTTKEIPIDLIISKLAQSSISAKDNIDNTLKNIKVTNETTKEGILNAIKVGVDTEAVKITIENFNKIDSTEINKGKITGIVKINDGKTEETIPVNLIIDQLNQSVSTIKKLLNKSISDFIATNQTIEKDILDSIYVANEDIKVKIEDFKKTNATDTSKGKITGNIIITDGTNTEEIKLDKTIDYLPQELDTAIHLVQNVINNTKADNSTSFKEILNKCNEVITNPKIKIYVEPSSANNVKATEFKEGGLTGTIIISNGSKDIEVPINLTIDRLPQTLPGAKENIEASLKEFDVTNDTKEEDVLKAIETNIRDKNISIKFGTEDNERFSKENATEFKDGSIKGQIIVSNGTDTVQVPVDLNIKKLPQTLPGAKENIEASLKEFDVTNDTKEEDVLKAIETNIRDKNISIKFGTEDNEKFSKENATEFKEGSIKGQITVSNGTDTVQVPVDLVIEKLGQGIYGAKESIKVSLSNIIATNETKAKDILNAVKTNVINKNLSINFGIEENETFKISRATEKETGIITGIIMVSDGTDTVQVPVDLVIEKLAQAAKSAKDLIENTLDKIKIDNNTSKEELENTLQNLVADNIKIEIKDFKKNESSNKEDGKITGTVIITDNNTGEKIEIPIDITIPKIEETLDEAKDTIDKVLPNINVDNNTSAEDIKNQIKDNVGGNIDVDIKDFKKNNATEKENGNITGTVIITDNNTGEKIEIPIDITIPKLQKEDQTLDEAKDTVEKVISTIPANNNTSKEGIEEKLKDKVGGNIDIKVNDFDKTEATEKKEGHIKGSITITDTTTGESTTIDIDVTIPKLPSTGGGSSSGGSGSHSHKNDKNDSSLSDLGNMKNQTTNAVENSKTGWKNSSGRWTYLDKNNKLATGWICIEGRWYYFNQSGTMQTGWINNNGEWYFCDNNGVMQTSWINNGEWYYLNPESDGTRGHMLTGWQYINENWYYLNPESDGTKGKMKIGWINDNGTWYYLDNNGAMAHDTYRNGYYLGSNGAWVK